jgi:23S rRNA (cytosine1962-C5)-methyltransferase
MEKSLKQEGWTEALPPAAKPAEVVTMQIKELGLSYEMDPYLGQKTGFYCDQRDTRRIVQHYAKDRAVLDVYCFTGAFAMHAAKGGARSVRAVDSSSAAIAMAKRNAALNQIDSIVFEEADASDVLSQAKDTDFIILDPPKLAPSQKHLHKAIQHYGQINEWAIRALPANGLLLTCSCSQAVSLEDLEYVVATAALHAGKSVQMLHHGGAGADHPINLAFMESEYLKWILVRVL